MKLGTFIVGNETRLGAERGDTLIDLNLARAFYLASRGKEARYLARDMLDLIQQGEDALDAAEETLEHLGSHHVDGLMFPVTAAKLVAPISNPSKIVAVGLNYWDHIRENGGEPPAYPVLFPKFSNALMGTKETIIWDTSLTQKLDWEAELAIVIGKRAKRVAAKDALDHVFGYCNLNDVSARDVQLDPKGSTQWARGKSFDTYCPIGPYIVTKDEIPDPQNLRIRSILNGSVMQDANTKEMINGIAKLIEFITQGITLLPGDLIATGTPAGVGHFRKPPIYMKSGDTIEIEIEGLGRLSNPVK